MDSITQVALGAAIGEATLGKKIGYRAIAWGAALGTLPDLDIIINPFFDSVVQLQSHRSFTHSITFIVLFSPLLGVLINRFHSNLDIGWVPWTKLAFFTFLTHAFIDIGTTYGTQFLFPFTNTPYTTDSIFIIDPLYTVPLLLGVIISMFLTRSGKARLVANYTGLTLSTLYLIWGLAIKNHVHSVFSSSFEHQYGYFEQMKTMPNGPSTYLWSGYAIKDDTVYTAVYSIFDDSKELEFIPISRQSHLITDLMEDRGVRTLLWFSRGYYSVTQENGNLYFYDLRFGRDDFWLTESGEFVWRNKLLFDEEGKAWSFEQSIPSFNTRSQNFSRYWNRIWGI